jgi:HAD superfamily hydrolase (TIGR01490 family)
MRYVAFFDLDNTILKIKSGEALLRKAYQNGLLSNWKLIHVYYLATLYKLHLIDPAIIIEKLSSCLAKSPENEIEALCHEIVEKDLVPAIRPDIINEIRKHKEQGAILVILSSAIASICFPLAKHLGMHAVICSELEVVNQQYTGRPLGKFCFRDEKLDRMNLYLANNNHSHEDSYYYADSIDDLPVLQSVGHPVCVNPDKHLEKIAQERNWVIHTWE